MAKHRRAEIDDADDDAGERRRWTSKRQRGGSWLFWLGSRLFVVALLLGVLVYFAPLLIGSTGLWKTLLATAAPEIAKQVDAKSLSLSWLAPIELRGLVVRDGSERPLAEVPLIKSRKTLLGIAINYRNVGTFEVEEPKTRIVLRADGSNVEDLLAKLPKSESKGESVGFGLALTKGRVELDDQVAGRSWVIDNLTVEADSPAAMAEKKSGKIAAVLRPGSGEGAAGQIIAEFSWTPGQSDKTPLGNGDVKLTLQGLPTEIVEGAVRRLAADIRPRGALTVQAAGNWNSGSGKLMLGQLTTPGISVSAPKLLGTDQPRLVITSGKANVQIGQGRAEVNELELVSNLVSIGGKGAAIVGSGGAAADDLEVRGAVNLAELARQLPATLRLRADSQVNSGVAEMTLASQKAANGRLGSGSLKTRDLRGVAAGKEVQLEQPVVIDFGVRQTAAGPVIDRLVGQASFLHLEGRGGLSDGSIKAGADLDKLVAELEQLVDFGDTRLKGSLDTDLRWKHEEQRGWTANADAVVKDFIASWLTVVAGKEKPVLTEWKEQRLHLAANVQGELADGKLAEVNTAKLNLDAGSDRLEAELTQSVKSPSASSAWPIKFLLRGELNAWHSRLKPFVSALAGMKVSGAIDVSGTGNVSSQVSEIAQTTVQISQLEVDGRDDNGAGLQIREPVVKLETAGSWSPATTTLTLRPTTFASSTVAFRIDDGMRASFGKEPSIVGKIDLRGDLGKLMGWMVTPQTPSSHIGGGLIGRVDIGYKGQALAATWTADIENLVYLVPPPPVATGPRAALASNPSGQTWQTLWHEPKVQITGQGTFDPRTSRLKIEQTSLASSTASMAAAGSVIVTGAPEVDLSGEIAYDLDLVTQQIQSHARRDGRSGEAPLPYGLDTLQLKGKERRKFSLKGPLMAATGNLTPAGSQTATGPSLRDGAPRSFEISEALAGEASLGWEGAQYVGLVAGPADFRAKLNSGVVLIGPLDIPISEGRLTTNPRMMLNNREPTVVVDRGPLLTNVRISPEMCSLWLKFVAPLLADATRAEGKFSLSLQGANVPLSAPEGSD